MQIPALGVALAFAACFGLAAAGPGGVRGLQGNSANAPGQANSAEAPGQAVAAEEVLKNKQEHDTFFNVGQNPQGHPNNGVAFSSPAAAYGTISYHNGPVMSKHNVYLIYFGMTPAEIAAADLVLGFLVDNISRTGWYGITTSYPTVATTVSRPRPSYTSNLAVGRSRGTVLSDSNIQAIVTDAIRNNIDGFGGAGDSEGAYYVLTGAAIGESSGFCTNYCGWHTTTAVGGKTIKFAFIGNPLKCPNMRSCAPQLLGPNGSTPRDVNSAADAMANVLLHEMTEMITDPEPLSGWSTTTNYENADSCAWTFGGTVQDPATTPPTGGTLSISPVNGKSSYNIVVTSAGTSTSASVTKKYYLIQQNLMSPQAPAESKTGCQVSA